MLAPPPQDTVEPAPVPSFSVIIAAYEAAEFVAGAVQSALAQTLPACEVIVSDDGSTDDIEAALEPYAERITFLSGEHRGEGAAKNTGARTASGEFLAFLDADDRYLPERLEALGELASARPDLDILTTDAFLELDGRVVKRYFDDTLRFEVGDQRRGILERNFIFGLVAVRRSRFIEIGGFEEAIDFMTDWDCWMRLIFSWSRAGLVNEPLVAYRVHERALSSDPARVAREEALTLERASRMLELSDAERSVLACSLERRRRAARLEHAREALLAGAPGARRDSLAIATRGGYGLRTRLKATLAAAAPGVIRRVLRARQRRGWAGARGVYMPRSGER